MSEFELHFVDREGDVPLLLIHGFPFDSRTWEAQAEGLTPQARLLAPDLPGFGDSPASTTPPSMKSYAEDCVALLDALDLMEPVVVGGLSMGGYAALAFAREFPERVAGLVLASTRAGADSAEGRAGRDQAMAAVEAQGVAALVEDLHPKLMAAATYQDQPEVAARLKEIMLGASPEGVIGALQAMRDRPDSEELLANLDVPALVVHGEEDGLIPTAEAETMAAALPRAELARVAGAGHLPNMEQAAVFNEVLGRFLAQNWA